MKTIIRLVLIFAFGVVIGNVYHDPINDKLNTKFGEETVKSGKAKIKKGGEKAYNVGNAGIAAIKEKLNSTETE